MYFKGSHHQCTQYMQLCCSHYLQLLSLLLFLLPTHLDTQSCFFSKINKYNFCCCNLFLYLNCFFCSYKYFCCSYFYYFLAKQSESAITLTTTVLATLHLLLLIQALLLPLQLLFFSIYRFCFSATTFS